MKIIGLFTFLLAFSSLSFSQKSVEFNIHDNGLMYNEHTMEQLKTIVDSLNLKFLSCDLDRTYYAKSQALGHYIYLEKGDIKSAKIAMEEGISLEAFRGAFPKAEVDTNLLIVKFKYPNYQGNNIVEFSSISLDGDYGNEITIKNNPAIYHQAMKGQWLIKYRKKGEYVDEYIEAFFFKTEFNQQELPETYARMIQYSDCMVDTTVQKFKENAEYGNLPYKEMQGYQNLTFPEKINLLEKLRRTKVRGYCSQDDSPRRHARNIALLSAETASWEVFLKAHLDIMNDRFERNSDGNYAWARRQTYIKELEELDINVSDLLLGISLRLENPSQNHYYGNIRRLGRAFSETNAQKEIEQQILNLIKDDSLDDYNRVIGYFLFLNYIYYLQDEALKASKIEALKSAIHALPDYLASRIKLEE